MIGFGVGNNRWSRVGGRVFVVMNLETYQLLTIFVVGSVAILGASEIGRLLGIRYGFASPRLQIPELLALYRNGTLKLRELITQTYCLDDINRGYADLDAGKNLRGVVVFDC